MVIVVTVQIPPEKIVFLSSSFVLFKKGGILEKMSE